ncbi:hypothetical protein WICPIJ_004034 [Wickerhamomyces pijperi]|uniref:Serine/threonine-protein phosphatase 2A activator n=1 Tax=Wickerhamomyces pijperi TaxID=599730 RepID=A0A9P8Q8I4_WICPI|nr:hypothetical protein WICPIJ_004034 [Wickerhamomyces pijperi]
MTEINLETIKPIPQNVDKSTNFTTPIKRILNESDIEKWLNSETFDEIFQFIQNLSVSVKGKDNTYPKPSNETIDSVLALLDEVDKVIENNPIKVDEHISRFGKIEFKDFYKELESKTSEIIKLHIPQVSQFDNDPCIELSQYFIESWGNAQRIDYGSGHELNFIAFLLILFKLDILQEQDYDLIVLRIFTNYMAIMRKLQKIYWLEPAGSHGVWGLDDYHFLPFLFGASQLSTHKHLKPKSIHDEDLVEMYYKKYMYFECIHFINSVKSSKLRWNSPMLDDISVVKTWSKVNEGMIKMYKVEVLSKLPIIQHFFFGEVLKAPEGLSNKLDTTVKHIHTNWGDCCGIKIPSAIGAAEINKFKPMPFD